MRALGIDVGSHSIKIAELMQVKKSLVVKSVFEKKLSPEISDHDKEIEAIEFMRHVAQSLNLENCKIVMGLKQDKVTVRKKMFPFSERLKILKSLSFEMEEEIPFDPDLCLFDAKTILQEGLAAHVLAVAAPYAPIEKAIKLAKDFNIELEILSVEGFAFANLLENWDQAPPFYSTATGPLSINPEEERLDGSVQNNNSIQVTLNIGHKNTLLCAQIEGRVVFIRSLLWGTDLIIKELAQAYQLPYLEAQKLLETKVSLVLSKKNQPQDVLQLVSFIESHLYDFARDIQMSLLEIQSEFHGDIKAIYLTGGLSNLPHLGAFLTMQLNTPVNAVSLIENYLDEAALRTQTSLPFETIKSSFGPAIGLALEAFKKPKNPALQFLKGEFAKDNNKLKTFWENWGTLVQTSAAAVVVLFIWASLRESYSLNLSEKGQEALTAQAKNVAKLPKRRANEAGIKKYIAENKKKLKDIKAIERVVGLNSALDVLKRLSENAPSNSQAKIDLVEVKIIDDQLKISGYASTPKDVSLLTQKLTVLSLDKKIKTEDAKIPSLPNRVTFSMSLKTDRGLVK